MNDSSHWRLSRRGFFAGAAGVTAAAAIPASSRVRAATMATSRARPALAAPTAGATIGAPPIYKTKNADTAATIFDGFTDTTLGLTIQKFYATEDILAETTLTSGMSQLASAGCKFLVDAKPSKHLSKAGQTGLSAWLTMLNNAGIDYRVVLYSEANNVAFSTIAQWQQYWSYYAPVIKDAGLTCGYNPGCGSWAAKALTFFPSNPAPDELWMDYYCTGFRVGSRLDSLIALAQSNGVEGAGMAEWGWTAGTRLLNPITIPWWNDYCGYLMDRVASGAINLGGIYFGTEANGATNNVINASNDPRIPMIQQVSTAFAAG